MIFSCTKKVRDKLKNYIEIEDTKLSPSLLNWYIDSLIIERKSYFLFTNSISLFTFYIYMGSNAERKNLEILFIQKLEEQLIREIGINQEYIEFFKNNLSVNQYLKTNNRSIVGSIVDFKQMIKYSQHNRTKQHIDHNVIINMLNISPMSYLKYSSPNRAMKVELDKSLTK